MLLPQFSNANLGARACVTQTRLVPDATYSILHFPHTRPPNTRIPRPQHLLDAVLADVEKYVDRLGNARNDVEAIFLQYVARI